MPSALSRCAGTSGLFASSSSVVGSSPAPPLVVTGIEKELTTSCTSVQMLGNAVKVKVKNFLT